jgi:hypothetical protein
MLRGILGILALTLACAASPAQADPTYGSTTGVAGVLYDDCVLQPYRYAVDVPDDAGYRALTTTLVRPDGAVADTDFVVPTANDASGTSTFRLCRPTDPFGTYTIRTTVEWGDDEESIGDPVRLADSHFSMCRPRTRTGLSVSTHRPAYGQSVRYRIRVWDERPAGFALTPFAWVVLQKRAHGHWVRIKDSRTLTHSTGKVTLRLRYRHHHQRMRVRAVTQPSDRFSRSVSAPVRIW